MSIEPIERRINWTQLNAIEWLRFDCRTQSKLNRILPRICRSIVECNRINRILRQISVRLIRLRSIDSAIVQSIGPIERRQSIERNRTQDPNRTQSNITLKSAVRLRFDCVQQSNRNYSIAFDCVRLVQLRFSFNRVRLTSSGNRNAEEVISDRQSSPFFISYLWSYLSHFWLSESLRLSF